MVKDFLGEETEMVLDLKGLLCPLSTIMILNTLKGMQKGAILKVITNNNRNRDTIQAMCAKKGYSLIEMKEENGLSCFRIRK